MDYNDFSIDEQVEICKEFKESYYPGKSLFMIGISFATINPVVEKENGKFKIWEVYRTRFEKLLSSEPNVQVIDTTEADQGGITKEGWISVEDRLPELPKPYYDKDSEAMLTPLNINVIVWDGEYVFEKSFGIIDWPKDITHWMPLPAPPGQSQTEQKLTLAEFLKSNPEALEQALEIFDKGYLRGVGEMYEKEFSTPPNAKNKTQYFSEKFGLTIN